MTAGNRVDLRAIAIALPRQIEQGANLIEGEAEVARPPEPDGDYHTIAGFALTALGHLPEVGETFSHEGWRFEIVDLDGRRIDKLLARKILAG